MHPRYTLFATDVGSSRAISRFNLFHTFLRHCFFFFTIFPCQTLPRGSETLLFPSLLLSSTSTDKNKPNLLCMYINIPMLVLSPIRSRIAVLKINSVSQKSCQRVTIQMPFRKNHGIFNVVRIFLSLSWRNPDPCLWKPFFWKR